MLNQWCLNEEFKTNVVYSRLETMDFTYVVGMDIGDGESMVRLFDLEKNEIQKMKFNFEDDGKLPTKIAFDKKGNAVIGKSAAKYPNFKEHFKLPPSQWDTTALVLDGKSYTYKSLMIYFIKTLWNSILKEDNSKDDLKAAMEQNKLLIAVGCPSSTKWTDPAEARQYQDLIIEATGYNYTALLAESTAAIMSAVCTKGTSKVWFDLDMGLAIIDAGSSTIDFTYVLLGKKLITASLNTAGSELDERLFDVALKESNLTRNDIPEEQLPSILTEIRGFKEIYYPEELDLGPKSPPIWGLDANGKGDKRIRGDKRLDYFFDKDFVTKAINMKYKQHPNDKEMSWKERCEKFISDCFALVDKEYCRGIILTGGTSFVTELKDLVVDVYKGRDGEIKEPGEGKEYTEIEIPLQHASTANGETDNNNKITCTVIESSNRDASVANGLCYAKAMEIRGRSQVAAYKSSVDEIANSSYHFGFLPEMAEYLSKAVCDDMLDVLNSFVEQNKTIYVNELLDNCNLKAQKDPKLTGEEAKDKIGGLFKKQFQNTQSALVDVVNKTSKNVYGAELNYVPKLSQLTDRELQELMEILDLSTIINEAWLKGTVLANAVKTTMKAALLAVDIMVAIINSVATVLNSTGIKGDDLKKRLVKFTTNNQTQISQQKLRELQGKLSNEQDRAKIVADCISSIRKSNIFEDEFKSYIADAAEAYLGKVLFLVYDEQPIEK